MLVELSYTMKENLPKWPTNPDEKYFFILSTAKGDVCNASSVYHHMHNGTHVDAPRHFDPYGKTIDQIPLNDFLYTKPYVLNLPKNQGERITLNDLELNVDSINDCDILLVYTGYSSYRYIDAAIYSSNFPSIAPDAAAYLRHNFPKLKALALDVISVDDGITAASEGFPSHHALLTINAEHQERPLLIYEDVNVAALASVQVSMICAFPIRWEGLEAAPVSMVAFTE